MDLFYYFLLAFSVVCVLAFAFVVFHVVTFALNRLNVYRVDEDKKPFSTRMIFFLALASGLSFVL